MSNTTQRMKDIGHVALKKLTEIDVKKMNPVGLLKKARGSKTSARKAQASKRKSKEPEVEKIVVGKPQLVKKNHMERDSRATWGISGLPAEWKVLLQQSGLKKEQILKDEKKAIAALNFKANEKITEVNRQPMLSEAELKRRMADTGGIVKSNPEKRYTKLEEIGEGASGVVFKVQRKSDNSIFAVKISSVEELKFIENEIAYHALSKHKNIVNYHETFQWKQDVWILMDLVDGGCLTDILGEENPEEWTEPYIAYVMQESLEGLQFMHDHHLLHRDIKSDNVLVGRDGTVKLADFGFAVGLFKEKKKRNTTVGTPFWMSPEVIEGKEYDERCDIWSLGITAIELVNHEPPHMDKPHVAALLDILTEPAPKPHNIELWSEPFLNFLEMMLKKDYKERWNATQLLGHEFLKKQATPSQFAGFVNHILDTKALEDDDEDDDDI